VTSPFTFDTDNQHKVDILLRKYPAGRQASAMLPLLDIAQRQNGGWLSREAIRCVADTLQVAEMRAYEVASFYTMFNLAPVGKHLIQFCCTTPCWLRGSDAVEKAVCDHLGVGLGQTTTDQQFTLMRVECLGACVNAPVVQINDDFYEDLTPTSVVAVLDALAASKTPPKGSQSGRQFSAPATI
jgi:NADH-quinone oxidoreductase subunit E